MRRMRFDETRGTQGWGASALALDLASAPGPAFARARAFAPGVLLALVLVAAILCPPAARAETPRRPEELTLGPLEFTPIQAERDTLACGIPVILYENHDLPLLDLTIQFHMGRRYLPVEDHATSRVLSSLWRDGGTTALPPDSLDAVLTALDATVTSGVGMRTGGVTISLTTEDAARALPIWRDVVVRPLFADDRLSRAKANRIQDLAEINNEPSRIASQRFEWLLYGEDYPGAHVDTRAEVDAISREALLAQHARFVHPENAIIGLSGDFDRAEMLAMLDTLFRDWPRREAFVPPAMATWTPHPEPGVHLLRGDYAQSQVRIGRLIPDLDDASPDLAACRILSFALGYERVFYRVRGEGLSYGSAVFLDVGQERSELAGFGSGRGAATLPLLRAMLEETAALSTRPITESELDAARIFQIGSEVRGSETAASIVQRKVQSVLRGRPADFYERLLERLKATTTDDLARVNETYVQRDDPWVVLVLGDPDQFGAPLDSLGLGPARELEPVVFGE